MEKQYGIIYCFINLINQKKYVGQTIRSLQQRINSHRHAVSVESNLYFHNAIQKYGEENFSVEILDYAYSSEELNQKEEDWIYILNTFGPEGYNMTSGGETIHHSEEFINNMKINNPSFRSDVKQKISEKLSNRRVYYNPETNHQIRRKIGDKIPNGYILGYPPRNYEVSQETKEKMRNKKLGIKRSKESIEKGASKLRNRKRSKECIEKGQKSRKIFHENNKFKTVYNDNGESHWIKIDDEIPEGFKRGRPKEVIEKIKQTNSDLKHCYNPITLEKRMIHENEELPEGFIFGFLPRTDEVKKKISESHKQLRWFYHPELLVNKVIKIGDEIPDGFIPGFIKKKGSKKQ